MLVIVMHLSNSIITKTAQLSAPFLFFGDVAFSEYFVPLPFLLLIVSRVRRTFFPSLDSVFLPCDHGLEF